MNYNLIRYYYNHVRHSPRHNKIKPYYRPDENKIANHLIMNGIEDLIDSYYKYRRDIYNKQEPRQYLQQQIPPQKLTKYVD